MMTWNKSTSSAALPSFSRRALLLLACTAVGVAACSGTFGSGDTAGAEYHVSSTRPSAQVTVVNQGDWAIVELFSDNGIGSASVSLVSGNWPGSIQLRFHLQGLEGLQFHYNETMIKVSVNTQHMVLQTVSVDGATEEAIDEDSNYWMAVAFEDREGMAVTNPVSGGVIVVDAPAAFLAGEYEQFTINWVDFYR